MITLYNILQLRLHFYNKVLSYRYKRNFSINLSINEKELKKGEHAFGCIFTKDTDDADLWFTLTGIAIFEILSRNNYRLPENVATAYLMCSLACCITQANYDDVNRFYAAFMIVKGKSHSDRVKPWYFVFPDDETKMQEELLRVLLIFILVVSSYT